jgi:hypothetical protein
MKRSTDNGCTFSGTHIIDLSNQSSARIDQRIAVAGMNA